MSFRHNEAVEICKKLDEGGSLDLGHLGLVVYHPATLLAAIGETKYLVRYDFRFAEDRTRLLVQIVEEAEVRPLPPVMNNDSNFGLGDTVDAYVNGAWWAGTVTRKVDPTCYVRLFATGNEMHCPFNRLRIHLDWVDGGWRYSKNNKCRD